MMTLCLIGMGWPARVVRSREASFTAGPLTCTATMGQIITLAVPSRVFHQPVPTTIYLPPGYVWTPGQFAVIYLLHGAGTDETQWPDLQVQPDADTLIAGGRPPFVVVMPGGGYALNIDYEAFVLNDLIPAVEGGLRVRRDAAGRAIGGISLGGYWALKTALQHPDLFAAVGGHSPVVMRGGADDPSALAATAGGLAGLSVTLDVGQGDALRATTEQLAGVLQGRGVNVALTISPGGHERSYWRAHIAEYLRFYLAALAPPPTAPCPVW